MGITWADLKGAKLEFEWETTSSSWITQTVEGYLTVWATWGPLRCSSRSKYLRPKDSAEALSNKATLFNLAIERRLHEKAITDLETQVIHVYNFISERFDLQPLQPPG